MLAEPTYEVARRVVEHIESDGRLVGLKVPACALDPKCVRFWIRRVVGDVALAQALTWVNAHEAARLIVERRSQCERMLAERALIQQPGLRPQPPAALQPRPSPRPRAGK